MTVNSEDSTKKALIAHLFRRAGFGVTFNELVDYLHLDYSVIVEQLLYPNLQPELDEDVVRRYNIDQNSLMLIESSQANWMYRIINTKRPLEEWLCFGTASLPQLIVN